MLLGTLVGRTLARLLGGRRIAVPAAGVEAYRVSRLIPGWARGQTWGRVVLLRAGAEGDPDLLRHELVHVAQWRRYGARFAVLYLLGTLAALLRYGRRHAYAMNPFEVEARR